MNKGVYEFEKHKLNNGSTLFYRQEDVKETVLQFLFKAGGARYDPRGLEGCAHLLEHSLWQEEYLRELEIRSEKLKNWFELSPYTNGQSIYIEGAGPSKSLKQLFSLLNNKLILSDNVSKEMIVRSKGEAIREMNVNQTDLRMREASDKVRSALFHDHPIGRASSALGNPETLDRIGKQDLIRHYEQFFHFSNLFVLAVTDVDKSVIKDLIKSLSLVEGKPIEYPEIISDFPSPRKNLIVTQISQMLDGRSVDMQAVIEIQGIVTSRDINLPWSLITRTLHEILYRELRLKQQLTYSVNVNTNHFRDIRKVEIRVRVSREEIERAKELIFSKLQSFQENKDLFEQIKKKVLYDFGVGRKSIEAAVGETRENIAKRDQIISLEDRKRKVEQVDFDQAVSMVKKWLNKDRLLTHFVIP